MQDPIGNDLPFPQIDWSEYRTIVEAGHVDLQGVAHWANVWSRGMLELYERILALEERQWPVVVDRVETDPVRSLREEIHAKRDQKPAITEVHERCRAQRLRYEMGWAGWDSGDDDAIDIGGFYELAIRARGTHALIFFVRDYGQEGMLRCHQLAATYLQLRAK